MVKERVALRKSSLYSPIFDSIEEIENNPFEFKMAEE